MEQTLNNTGPVVIEASLDGIDRKEYASWHEACCAVFNGAKARARECLGKEQLHKIVLTGGATVMPEVRQIAQECFVGTELVCSREPHLSVVKGLAYVGLFEILQRQVKKLEDAFNDIFFP